MVQRNVKFVWEHSGGATPAAGYRIYETTAGQRNLVVDVPPSPQDVTVTLELELGQHVFTIVGYAADGEGPEGPPAACDVELFVPTAPTAFSATIVP